jgi:peptide/nickel transport system permease protein
VNVGLVKNVFISTPPAVVKSLLRLLLRIAIILLVGGFCGALLIRMAPGFGVDEGELNSHLNGDSVRLLRESHEQTQGLGRFYFGYLKGMLHGDLGMSDSFQKPVTQLLAERFPETIGLVALGLCTSWTAGFALAMTAVMSRGSYVGLLNNLLASALLCVPAAVLALLCTMTRTPAGFALGLIVLPKVFYYARNVLAHSASLPHVVTARATGASDARVLVWHILPLTASQLLALAGVTVGTAFAAAIPVEVLFDLPGIGQLAWKAAMSRDMGLLVILVMIVTLITAATNSAAEMAGKPLQGGTA